MDRLGLSEDELCRALDVDPLSVISGELDHKPQLAILLALTEEAGRARWGRVLRRWLRASGPAGRPLDHLLTRDFGAFEDALADARRARLRPARRGRLSDRRRPDQPGRRRPFSARAARRGAGGRGAPG